MPANLEGMDLPDTKKKYIYEQVNPLLEELVRAVLTKMPEDPLAFMIKWLKEKTGRQNVDLEALAKENTGLETEIRNMQTKLQEVQAKAAGALKDKDGDGADAEEETEDEDDDYVDEIPDNFRQTEATAGRARQSVSAEAYGAWNKEKAFIPPKHPKSDEQKERIKEVLKKNFLFEALEDDSVAIILDAVKEVIVDKDQRIIQQGDDGDFMFVIETGTLECFIKIGDGEKMVKTCEAGDAFGELALLYNCPRAASVQAKDRSVCWQLDRETFNHIVKSAASKKRERYGDFLKSVPLLSAVDAYGKSQVADALKTEDFAKGDEIIKQGEKGDKFFIIEEGSCKAVKSVAGSDDQTMELSAGDYFGELALLNNEPRAASVLANSDKVKLLVLDRRSFNRLLGPLRELLAESAQRYA